MKARQDTKLIVENIQLKREKLRKLKDQWREEEKEFDQLKQSLVSSGHCEKKAQIIQQMKAVSKRKRSSSEVPPSVVDKAKIASQKKGTIDLDRDFLKNLNPDSGVPTERFSEAISPQEQVE
jgi:hypothetical protein